MKVHMWISVAIIVALIMLSGSPANGETTANSQPPTGTDPLSAMEIWSSPVGYVAVAGLLAIELGILCRGFAKPDATNEV